MLEKWLFFEGLTKRVTVYAAVKQRKKKKK